MKKITLTEEQYSRLFEPKVVSEQNESTWVSMDDDEEDRSEEDNNDNEDDEDSINTSLCCMQEHIQKQC